VSDYVARQPLKAAALANGLRTLAVLLEAGLPINRVLRVFSDVAPTEWHGFLPEIERHVREGGSLTSALERSEAGVPTPLLGMLRAGEVAGAMGKAAAAAARIAEQSLEFQRSLRAALSYPILLAAVGACALGLVTGFALPRFASLLGDLGAQLPPLTRAVLRIATGARTLALPAGLTIGISAALFVPWSRTANGIVKWHGVLLALPVIGRLRLSAAAGRSCAALSALLENGVPLVAAIGHAALASGDAEVARRMLSARGAIMSGVRPSTALSDAGALPPAATKLVRAGEESGRLAQLLAHASRLEVESTQQSLAALVRYLEPALILMFGGLIALVSGALLQAVYAIRPAA